MLLYDGKAKQVLSTDKADEVIISYKDDARAYNGIKKAKIKNKGILNNKITSHIFQHLNDNDVSTHLIKRIDDRNQLCKKVEIFPMEVICRNVACGSLCTRFGFPEGKVFSHEIMEYCYKSDELDDPHINFDIAVELGIADKKTLKYIDVTSRYINKILKEYFDKIDIILVDFKMEFGVDSEGNILLADEISPDTARLWDKSSKEKLDKDRFRRDLGRIEEAYAEILKRLDK